MNHTMTFEAIGTHWVIDYQSASTEVEAAILARCEAFDKTYSRFRTDSLVHEISLAKGGYEFPADAQSLFNIYRQLYDATDNKMTPMIGNLMAEAGYDAAYSLTPSATLHTVDPWDQVMRYDHPRLTTERPVMLDFGAAGKGYLIDLLGEVFEEHRITDYLIDGSGDFLRRGSGVIRVGLQHPEDETLAIGVAELSSGSLCASATNRRSWGEYHHIIDPDTREPVRDVIATWTTAGTAILADGLATALFFTPAAQLQDFEFEYCLMRADHQVESSPQFPAELFTGAAA